MVITLNNRREEIPDHKEISVEALISYKNFTFKFLAVRVNGRPVQHDAFGNTLIRDGDQVQIWHLISGG